MGLQGTIIFCKILSILISVIGSEFVTYNFPSFEENSRGNFTLVGPSNIARGALQVTPDTSNPSPDFSIANQSGRVLIKQPFRLWKSRGSVQASFNSTFVINIHPVNGSGGEGIAFIMTNDGNYIPQNSYGEWLGLFNSTTNGDASNKLVAVEFDTKRNGNSYDPDGNHVAVDVNSINSTYNASLNPYKIYLNSSSDVVAMVRYNGGAKNMSIFVGNDSDPILSVPIDLSKYLDDKIFVGFSASTGNDTELNCIKSWSFSMDDLGGEGPHTHIVGLAVGLSITVIALFVIISSVIVCRRRKRVHRKFNIGALERTLTGCSTEGPHKYKFTDLKKATDNFDPKNLLGRGGFGSVYKGILPKKKLPVAVKRVSQNSDQGEQEFIAEVRIISRIRHRNLVRLLGWCHENGELLLVYDFMPNGSLEKLIFLNDTEGPVLNWEKRYKIVCGVASALNYLHEECEHKVVHRDLKASNVMLDSDYNPRLGDFGLARLIERNKTSYTASGLAGTPGYIAPECFHTGRATTESDVYGFGAVALEVACGRRPQIKSDIYIVDWVWRLFREGRLLDAADPRLGGEFDEDEMKRLLLLGLACSHPNPQERPTTRRAVQILTKDAPIPMVPVFKPAFVWPAPPSALTQVLSTDTDLSSMYNSNSDIAESGLLW